MKTIRRRERSWPILVALTLTMTLSAFGREANAQQAVFVVAKAEAKFDRSALTDVGRKKVQALAGTLMDADIAAIYAIDHLGAVLTAEPIAKELHVKLNKIPPQSTAIDDWARRLRTEHAEQRVLVITVGPGPATGEGLRLLKGLGVPDKEIWARRSDHLFLILPKDRGEPSVIKMRW
ncbi:MAG TPA: hypothetical protein VEG60_22960 [Candidatus Binatia bacterium]|nr:hypothetical protein [Candidatus Binatia bacterium]